MRPKYQASDMIGVLTLMLQKPIEWALPVAVVSLDVQLALDEVEALLYIVGIINDKFGNVCGLTLGHP